MANNKCVSDLFDNKNLSPYELSSIDSSTKEQLLEGSNLQIENLLSFINKCKNSDNKDGLLSEELGSIRFKENRESDNVKLYEGIYHITKYLIKIPEISKKTVWTEPSDIDIFKKLCKIGRDEIISLSKLSESEFNSTLDDLFSNKLPIHLKYYHLGRKKKSKRKKKIKTTKRKSKKKSKRKKRRK